MKAHIYISFVMSIWMMSSISVHAEEQLFEPRGSYNCMGKEDGFIVNVINEHVVSVSTGGAEITYYRVILTTRNKLEALAAFDGFKAPIDGKLSAELTHKTKMTLRPGKNNNQIMFEGHPVSQACNK